MTDVHIPPPPPRPSTLSLEGLAAAKTPRGRVSSATGGQQTETRTTPARGSVVLPPSLAHQLRERAAQERRTHADLILTALLDHYSTVATRVNSEDTDSEREALGLPPLRPSLVKPDRATEQISITMLPTALERLDHDASRLKLGRSQLVAELLSLEFASD